MTAPTPPDPREAGSAAALGASVAQLALRHGRDGVLPSSALLGPRQAIEIEHNGQRYRLQSTKSGKLILTK